MKSRLKLYTCHRHQSKIKVLRPRCPICGRRLVKTKRKGAIKKWKY